MERILFLDIDGVINNDFDKLQNMYDSQKECCNIEHMIDMCQFCLTGLNNLDHIIDNYPEIRIVLISSWRHLGDIHYLRKIFSSYRFSKNLIDKTGLGSNRALEVITWLYLNGYLADDYNHEKVKYVILDDCDDNFSIYFPDNYINVGGIYDIEKKEYPLLSEDERDRIIKILN